MPSAHRSSDRGEWRGEISPPRSLRTGHDTLVSSGSHCSAASIEQAPMCEQPRLMACDARQPVSGSPLAPEQGLKLSGGPSRQDKVDVLQGRIEGRRTEPPIVVDPRANVRVEHPREVIQGFVTAPMHRPTPDSPTDRRERRCAGGGTERDAHTPGPFAHHPWPESVAEKVELKSRMIFTSTLISAIDDFRLVRMQRQSAISKPRLKSCPQRRGLVLWQIASSA
jgi:hypothetical protein